jgi:hypothetical protein
MQAGAQGIADWEHENGLLTEAELAEAQRAIDAMFGSPARSWFDENVPTQEGSPSCSGC